MYKSYSYNNMPRAITEKSPPQKPTEAHDEHNEKPDKKKESFLDNLEADDIILIIVIAALLLEDCNDKLLLIALAFIFLGDQF